MFLDRVARGRRICHLGAPPGGTKCRKGVGGGQMRLEKRGPGEWKDGTAKAGEGESTPPQQPLLSPLRQVQAQAQHPSPRRPLLKAPCNFRRAAPAADGKQNFLSPFSFPRIPAGRAARPPGRLSQRGKPDLPAKLLGAGRRGRGVRLPASQPVLGPSSAAQSAGQDRAWPRAFRSYLQATSGGLFCASS